jgi:hypothetical protein
MHPAFVQMYRAEVTDVLARRCPAMSSEMAHFALMKCNKIKHACLPDKRTPGLFKVEFEGKSTYALCSKLYFVEDDTKNKYSCKGINKNQNEISKDRFHNVLFNNEKDMCVNKGFRVVNNEMVTYIQQKRGLSYYYDKGKVLADGVSTVPLDI